ncbi:MAG TPA: hypothetical protein VHG32_04300 [Thermoanaerobaculia bacterium]|jgi:hypothetical protein|nr:hypothetical protein [Thermoanaerobaculia bacterium]
MAAEDSLDLPDLDKAIEACTVAQNADMFSYSGRIYSNEASDFISYILRRKKHDNINLVLTTYGGDAHSAYRLARSFQYFFKTIKLLVVGPCKSAGTLVTICAHELVFGPFGELGPLDIQVTKKDDLVAVGSGLDTFQALAILQTHAFSAFEEYMLSILDRSQGAISTKTACDVACQLVSGVFGPIAAQIDPQKMGEMQRQIDIAKAYGERIGKHNLRGDALDQLVRDYPSHSFIIDYKEARRLFKKVSRITAEEVVVMRALQNKGACVFRPGDDIVFSDVSELTSETQEAENEAASGDTKDPGSNDAGAPGDPQSPTGEGAQGVPAGGEKSGPRKPRRKVGPL